MHQFSRECHFVHFFSTSGDSRANSPQAGESKGASMFTKRLALAVGLTAAGAVGALSAQAASAASIDFSYNLFSAGTPGSGLAGDSSVIPFNQTDGLAIYFPAAGSSNITIANGDTFTPVTVTGHTLSSSNAVSGLSFAAASYANGAGTNAAGTAGDLAHQYAGYFSSNGSTAVPLTTGDPLLDSVFAAGGNYDGTTGDAATVTLGGLTVGQSYQFEVYVIDSRSSQQNHNGIGGGRSMIFFNGNESTIAAGAYSATSDFPTGTQYQYAYGWGAGGLNGHGSGTAGTTNYIGMAAVGTFTADATTQTFDEQQFNTDSSPLAIQGSQFNAFLLTPVPEPATVALFGLAAAAGMLLLRRRHPAH